MFFRNFNFSYFKIKQNLSCSVFLKSFDHFMMFLFVSITFDPILDDFLRFWSNPEVQDGGPRWPSFRIDYAIITSCDVITSKETFSDVQPSLEVKTARSK